MPLLKNMLLIFSRRTLLALFLLYSVVGAAESELESLTREALVLYRQGKLEPAQTLAEAALKVAEREYGPEHLLVH